MSENENIIESGSEPSRRASDIPDRMMIGNGREPKQREEEIDDVIDEVADDTGDVDASQVSEVDESEDDQQNSNDGTGASDDDELIDVLIDADVIAPRTTQTQEHTQVPNTNELYGTYLEEYKAVVESYGEELADKIVKPRLIREQKLEAQLAPWIQTQQQQAQKEAAEAERTVLNFFDEMSNAGFNSVYGTTDSRRPIQNEACKRVLAKAIEIKNKVEAAGLTITPRKALAKAHEQVWGNSPIAKRVRQNQTTMDRRSENTSLPATRGGVTGSKSANKSSPDRYSQVRNALKRAGFAR